MAAERRQQRLDVQAARPASSGRTARTSRPMTSSRRWAASSTAGNAGLKGVIDATSAKAIDPATVEFTLVSANGNFPYLVSVFNAQTVITPADLRDRHDSRRACPTAPARGSSRPTTSRPARASCATTPGGAARRRSTRSSTRSSTRPARWSPPTRAARSTPSSSSTSSRATALFSDANFQVNEAATTNHRQIWFRTDTGQFTDKRVRQAVALSLDREAMVQQLFQGRGEVANDHVIFSCTRTSTRPSRSGRATSRRPRPLLAEAGATGLTATLHVAELQEIPDLAVLIQSQAAEAGITLTPGGRVAGHVLRCPVVPGRAGRPALLRRRRARHRRLRPPLDAGRVPQLGAQDQGRVELVAVQLASPSTTRSPSSRRRSASMPRRPPAARSRPILNDDVAVSIPYTYSFLSGNAKTFTGVYSSALGQMFVQAASKVG